MTEQQRREVGGVDGDPAALLQHARDRHRDQVLAERDVFVAAAEWAAMHAEDSITQTDWTAPGGQTAQPVAGAGCPLVAEFVVAEFAAVIGRSTDSGRRFLGHAVETRYRLPRLWAEVVAGRLAAWRAASVAEATMPLCAEAAGFVDAQVAAVAGKIGPAQLGRLIGEAITRFDPDQAETERAAAADGRHFDLHFAQTGGLGLPGTEALVALDGLLDYADARALETAVQAGAAQLADLGSTDSLDVRRSHAAGALARGDLTLGFEAAAQAARKTPARQVVIYAHLSADAVTGTPSGCDLARVEGHGWVTADQVATWCGPETQVIVKPVIDTTSDHAVDAYEIPDRLAEQVQLTRTTCAFPACTRPSRGCDVDHVIPAARGGPTSTDNLAPLCRQHHRLKTHTAWSYQILDTGTYLWTSPHGHHLLVDPSGTTLLNQARGRTAEP